MANEAIMPIVATYRDEASAGMRTTSRSVMSMSRDVRTASTAIGHFGQAMTNILVLTNLLPGTMGNTVSKTLLLGTTAINAAYAVMQLVQIYEKLNIAHRASIALQSIMLGLSGVNAGRVAVGLAVGAAAVAGTAVIVNRATAGNGGGGRSGATTGEGSISAGRVAVGPAGGATTGEGSITIINNGAMMGNEQDAVRLAREIQRLNRQDARVGR